MKEMKSHRETVILVVYSSEDTLTEISDAA